MLQLAPRDDWDALAAAYHADGRVQVRDVLTAPSAAAIEAQLKEQTPWGLCFNQGQRVAALREADIAALPREKRQQMTQAVAEGARAGFQFFYRHYPLFTDYFDAARARTALYGLFEFINGADFLGFVRRITGEESIVWADAHATRYEPGHFLMKHNDEMPGAHRRAAYVLNFTRDWRPDWGGYLQFFGENGDVVHGFRPLFNAINLFAVPREHSVEAVSPFAQAPRLSVTGWLRADQPPGPIAAA